MQLKGKKYDKKLHAVFEEDSILTRANKLDSLGNLVEFDTTYYEMMMGLKMIEVQKELVLV